MFLTDDLQSVRHSLSTLNVYKHYKPHPMECESKLFVSNHILLFEAFLRSFFNSSLKLYQDIPNQSAVYYYLIKNLCFMQFDFDGSKHMHVMRQCTQHKKTVPHT